MKKWQKGSLLVVAAILVGVVGVYTGILLRLVGSNTSSSNVILASHQAKSLADSGLQHGLLEIKNNLNISSPATYCDGNWKTTQSLGEGQFRFMCQQYSPSITTTTTVQSSDMVIPVSSLTGVAPLGRVTIDSEKIDYSSTSTSTSVCGTQPCLVVAKRGVDGTSAATHTSSTAVAQSQLVLEAEGAVPTIASPTSAKTLQEAIIVSGGSGGGSGSGIGGPWAVGHSGSIYEYDGTEWTVTSSPTALVLNDVACDGNTACWAVGTGGTIYKWDGSTWALNTTIPSTTSLDTVTCTPDGTCFTGDDGGNIYEWNGSTWALSGAFGAGSKINSISCYGDDMCITVGAGGSIHQWTGSTWSSMTSGTSQNLLSSSCGSSSICYAVGAGGTILKMNGSTWSAATSPTALSLVSISCPDTINCWAVTPSKFESAHTTNGTTWTNQTVTVPEKEIYSVHCITPDLCYLAMEKENNNFSLIGEWDGNTWKHSEVEKTQGAAENLLSITGSGAAGGGALSVVPIVWREVFN